MIANTVTGSAKNFLRSSCLLLELAKSEHLIPWLIAIYPCEKSVYKFLTGIDLRGQGTARANFLYPEKPPEGGLLENSNLKLD